MNGMKNDRDWSQMIGELAADALLTAGIISNSDNDRTIAIIAEEVLVRLCLNDRPSPIGN